MNNNTNGKEAQAKVDESDSLEFIPEPNRPYDYMWDMYLDEFEDYKENSHSSEGTP